jgi:hypothetical protein
MSSEAMREVLQLIDAKAQSRPTPMEFEFAYQARVAMDRIRFAIKHTEQFAPQTEQMQEAGLQLLDALQRLETADRRFQERSHLPKTTGENARQYRNGHHRAMRKTTVRAMPQMERQ